MRLNVGVADLRQRQLYRRDGTTDRLTHLEADLLGYFARHRDLDVGRDDLGAAVWDARPPSSRAIDVAIRRLRTRIEVDPSRPTQLVTLHGHGYRFVSTSERRTSSNILAPPDRFVGREQDRERLGQELTRPGLVTLVGPPGIGKTRLARELGRDHHARGHGAALGVSLATARDAESVVRAVASTLELSAGAGSLDTLITRVGHAVASRGSVVVVLDNLEQVVEDARAVLPRWMALAPRATFLATSRGPLALDAERVHRLEPLPTRDARALFLARARAVRPLLEDEAIDELVDHLDGVPLAIELAAARVGVLGPRQMVRRIEERFKLLGGGTARSALWDSIDQSWQLLEPPLRAALARCAVFEGGFELDAARAVLGPEAAPSLDALVRWSLVQVGAHEALPERQRYTLLESIHAFASHQLDGDDRQRAEVAHASFYADLGEDQTTHPLGSLVHTQRLRVESPNILAAHGRMLAIAHHPLAARIALALTLVSGMEGPPSLSAEILARSDHPSLPPATRAELLACRTRNLARIGDTELALRVGEQARQLAMELGDDRLHALALSNLGNVHMERGDLTEAAEVLRLAVDILEASHPSRVGSPVGDLAIVLNQLGRTAEAEACHQRALEVHRQRGDWVAEAVVLGNLAILAAQDGRIEVARERFRSALEVHRAVGYRRAEGLTLGNLAELEGMAGHPALAEQLMHEALAIHRELGNTRLLSVLLGNVADLELRRGATEAAIDRLREALELQEAVGNPADRGFLLGELGRALLTLGDLRGAADQLEIGIADLERGGGHRLADRYRAVHGAVLAALARPEEASSCFARSEQRFRANHSESGLAMIEVLRDGATQREVPPDHPDLDLAFGVQRALERVR